MPELKKLLILLCFCIAPFCSRAQDSSAFFHGGPFLEVGAGVAINPNGLLSYEESTYFYEYLLAFNKGETFHIHIGMPVWKQYGIAARYTQGLFIVNKQRMIRCFEAQYPGTSVSAISKPWQLYNYQFGIYKTLASGRFSASAEILFGKGTVIMPFLQVIANRPQGNIAAIIQRESFRDNVNTYTPSIMVARKISNDYYWYLRFEVFLAPTYNTFTIASYPEKPYTDTLEIYAFPALTFGFGTE